MHIDNLYEHQREYYNALVDKKSRKKNFKSLICIPTGGGKTLLAVTYLINNHLNNNQKVVWIAHSQFLLNQAYDVFFNQGYTENDMICIHSNANNFSNIQPHHKIIIISFQSLIKNKDKLNCAIGENVVIIIDEAHHLIAKSYMDCISDYAKNKLVLGLTATPIRSKSNESLQLYNYFKDDLGVKVHMAQLFKEKTLVKPIFEEVYYNLDNKDISTINDISNNLSKASNYNDLILKQYLNNISKYGKTVIFAINIEHANLLYKIFQNTHLKDSVYIVHSRLNNSNEQFEKFKNSEKGILININILNEGVDIPDIQTIFLTKPLNSRIAVTQIVGRSLRKSKNKTHANIVNFAVANIGRKLLLVTPKMSYNMYEATWQNEETVDNIEKQEQQINILQDIVQKLKANNSKSATCSFFNIFVVGYYTILDDDSTDLMFPVTFQEYIKIEKYKNKQSKSFPKNFFLMENEYELKERIDNNANIIFTFYDVELLKLISGLEQEVITLYTEYVKNNYTLKQLETNIEELFNRQHNDVKYYLNQISANSLKTFAILIRQQFVEYKYIQTEEI